MPTTLTAMLRRFGGLTKAEMVKKFNHPNCAPSWDERDVGLAKKFIIESKMLFVAAKGQLIEHIDSVKEQ